MVGFLPGILSFALPKFAVVALLTRIMNTSRIHRIFLWTMTSLCLLSLLGCIIILFAQCTPAKSQWDFSIKGKCWDPWVLVHYSMYAGGQLCILSYKRKRNCQELKLTLDRVFGRHGLVPRHISGHCTGEAATQHQEEDSS